MHPSHNRIGYTDIISERGISKTDPRVVVNGTIDEANAALGMAKALSQNQNIKKSLEICQKDLSAIMAFIARINLHEKPGLSEEYDIEMRLQNLIEQIEFTELNVAYPDHFIVSGENPASASLDFARAVVRRAEREVVRLFNDFGFTCEAAIQYLNRLSTFCYLLELQSLESEFSKNP